ncbi:C-C motif chemokine 27a [Betta splendens]|uniref:C-C motif chemokine 27a n=1 Tax=Betta splendens TaxID=158456 RepID=A0A8M1HI71_BETSP|nr:C-C motif chemokine 27a [Betta splendens]
MDLKVVCVVACLCALALAPAEGAIPKCCVRTRSYVSAQLVRNAYRIDIQDSTGPCDIDAVILYVKYRKSPICVNPWGTDKMMKKLDKLKA